MRSYILMQPDRKYAVFSAISDDFTSFGMTGGEALAWGIKQWGSRIGTERFASAVADEPIGASSKASLDGLGRWRSSLVEISAAYGLKYLQTTLAEIGFSGTELPQAAIDGLSFDIFSQVSNVVELKQPIDPLAKFQQSDLAAYLLKLSLGLRRDD